jgi:formate hydrogenlyase transcriptional activator
MRRGTSFIIDGAVDQAQRYRTLLDINNALISNLTQGALFHAIAQAVRHVVPFDRTSIFLHDPEKDVLRISILESSLAVSQNLSLGVEVSAHDSHAGWVFQNQRPLLRRDLAAGLMYPMEDRVLANGFRSYVLVPLIVRGRSIGILGVASTEPNRYDETDVDFLKEVANQVAMAVENMKAYASIGALNAHITEAAERSRALLEINNLMISNLTRDALFGAIAQALHRVIPFDRTAVLLHDAARDVLRVAIVESSIASTRFKVGLEVAVEGTHMGWVFRTQQPLLRGDAAVEREYASEELNVADGVRSLLVVPLIVRGQSIGTLGVSSTATDQYTKADAVLLQEVANQIAMAVENMKAYEEISTLKARLERENVYLQEEIRTEHNFVEMVGSSPALLEVLQSIERVAPTDATVLIFGETGTGKELVARAIHARSTRRDRALVKVNCGAISAGLVESELFGHMKGAFTGALERRIGRFELADAGTIFLDEIGELPLDTQVKLLRVLQDQEFEPVGSSHPIRVDVRVIAATNRDLDDAVRSGRFRADLFYRLNVFPIRTPPLRERAAEIPQLAAFFLGRFAKKFGKGVDRISKEMMDRLMAYSWPGNIRELQNVIERAVVLSTGPVLDIDPELPGTPSPGSVPRPAPTIRPADASPAGLDAILRDVEIRHIRSALDQAGWVIDGARGAARILGLHPNTLRSRVEKLGIRRVGPEVS